MKSVNTILNEIRYWINQYHECSDGASIDGLLDIQDQIAVRSYTLASHVASYKGSYNRSYFIRKIGVAKSSLSYQKSGSTLGRSDHQALLDNADNYEVEQSNEATAVELDLLLRQTNVILQAIAQRISYLKQEKKSTSSQNVT